jgi:hypothetical protein
MKSRPKEVPGPPCPHSFSIPIDVIVGSKRRDAQRRFVSLDDHVWTIEQRIAAVPASFVPVISTDPLRGLKVCRMHWQVYGGVEGSRGGN